VVRAHFSGFSILVYELREKNRQITERNVFMIPQAIAKSGPYAALWSDLKSMRYALDRAMNADKTGGLADLDRCRLRALANFLRSEFDPPQPEDGFRSLALAEPRYSLDVDLQQMVKEIKEFKEWRHSSRLGAKEKVMKLVAALEDYQQGGTNNLFPKPPEEFWILHAILSELLLRTEVELVS